MQVKNGRYLADWHDWAGQRRRRSFTREKDALRFAARMRALAALRRAAANLGKTIHWKQRDQLHNLVELLRSIDQHFQREEDMRAVVAAEDRRQRERALRRAETR